MKYSKTFCATLLCFCIHSMSYADKAVDKKGTILNSNCKPFGTRCGGASNKETSITYVYNEPNNGSFSLQISEDEVLNNDYLKAVLLNKLEITIEEEMLLPAEIVRKLNLPDGFKIQIGKYPIQLKAGFYTIIFIK